MIPAPNPTIQAIREVLVAALTSPALSYTTQAGTTASLPAANVIPKSVWLVTAPASPLVAFDVSGRGAYGRLRGERELDLHLWVLSTSGPDECTLLYEAVRGRIDTADQETPGYTADLSRPASGSALGVAVRYCSERDVMPVDFEQSTQRWYISATYRIVAN